MMKRLLLGFALLIGFSVLGASAFAATKIDLVQYKNYDAAYAGIGKQAKAGWLPVGVDVFEGGDYEGVWILFEIGRAHV